MSDGPDSLVLNLLRHIRGRVDDNADNMIEIKERLGLLEGSVASVSRRVDRLDMRVERIERRLELTDASIG